MNITFSLLVAFLFLFPEKGIYPSPQWTLKKVKDDIEVYTRNLPNTTLKELKIELFLDGTTLSRLLTVLGDTPAYPRWVYKCTTAKKILRTADHSSYDYYVLDFPWPLSDRELYCKSTYQQDPQSKKLIIETRADGKYAPAFGSGKVRIQTHYNKWVLQPLSPTRIKVSYFLNSNPGGNIPEWVVNAAIDHGPVKTMLELKNRLYLPQYQNARMDWILEY